MQADTGNTSIHMSCILYVFDVFWCMYVLVYVCMLCICSAYIKVLCYIACICLYFLQAKVLVGWYNQHTGNIYTYMQIKQRYIQNTCKNTCKYMQIHTIQTSEQKVHMLVIKCYICMYLHVWVIHVCYM